MNQNQGRGSRTAGLVVILMFLATIGFVGALLGGRMVLDEYQNQPEVVDGVEIALVENGKIAVQEDLGPVSGPAFVWRIIRGNGTGLEAYFDRETRMVVDYNADPMAQSNGQFYLDQRGDIYYLKNFDGEIVIELGVADAISWSHDRSMIVLVNGITARIWDMYNPYNPPLIFTWKPIWFQTIF